jgi:hypothetical protein
MRVTVLFDLDAVPLPIEIPGDAGEARGGSVNLRANPAKVEEIEPAKHHRPLRNFLLAVNGSESMFSSVRCRTWLNAQSGGAEAVEFGSQVDLIFADRNHNFEGSSYATLTDGLRDLLNRESASDAVRAEFCVRRCTYPEENRAGFALLVFLYGSGASPEQAELRWSLGLAHLQQALLFLSRAMRHQQTQPN